MHRRMKADTHMLLHDVCDWYSQLRIEKQNLKKRLNYVEEKIKELEARYKRNPEESD